jgi:two-component system, OmpR family, sensor kinase
MTEPPETYPAARRARWTRLRGLRELPSRTPLRVKLVAILLGLVTIALLAAGLAATTALRGYLVDQLDGPLTQAAIKAAHPPYRGSPTGPGPSPYFAATLDGTGAPDESWPNTLGEDQSGPSLPRMAPAQAAARGGHPFTVPAAAGSGQWRVAIAAVGPSGTLLVAQSLSGVAHTVHRLVVLQLGIGGAVLVLLAGVGPLVVRRSLRPLTAVEHTAAAIAAGDLSQRVPDSSTRTEVGRLSAALNGMLGQIERAFRVQQESEAAARKSEQQMRQFIADASHELRTPLTSIRGFAELHRQGAAVEPGDVARLMRRIEDEAARMGLLVEDLLLLARLDQQRPLERKLVDLLTLAADAVHDARAVAPNRPITLDIGATDVPPVVIGDEARLRQVLGNLVSNALHHTPEHAAVTVRVGSRPGPAGQDGQPGQPGQAVLEVIDAGPGLAPAEAERVFERFYRAEKSRARSSGGTGLGLSIVAGLTAAHGGRMEVDTAVGAGATFRVLLPLAVREPSAISS